MASTAVPQVVEFIKEQVWAEKCLVRGISVGYRLSAKMRKHSIAASSVIGISS
jgi:hypothetical protein